MLVLVTGVSTTTCSQEVRTRRRTWRGKGGGAGEGVFLQAGSREVRNGVVAAKMRHGAATV